MKLKICVALLALCLCAVSLFADNVSQQATAASKAQAAFGALPLSFEPTATSDRYLSRSGRYAISLGATESSIAVTDKSGNSRTLRFAFENGDASAVMSATDVLPGITNYYVGNDPRNWRLGVRNFAKVHAKGVYPGVDVVYYGEQKHLEFDFVVAPGADPSVIAMTFAGMNSLKTNADGALVADLGERAIAFQKPLAYQVIDGVRKPVSVEYAMAGANKTRLNIGAYDKSRELVIDPVIKYSLYMGGTGADAVNGIVVNAAGEAYITGQTCSTDFYMPNPNLSTATAFKGTCDAFVSKLSADGSAVLFTTLIGGALPEPVDASASGNAIALDRATPANIYIAGTTNFRDLPVKTAAHPSYDLNSRPATYNGGDSDAFVFILNSTTGAVTNGTYLGGGLADEGNGVAVDAKQNVSVVGHTCSLPQIGKPEESFPAYNSFQPITEHCVAFATRLDFGLHIPDPGKPYPIGMGEGASAISPRPASLADNCSEPCPAVPDETKTYYFFSTVFGGQQVAPWPTWTFVEGRTHVAGALTVLTPPTGEPQVLYAVNAGVGGPLAAMVWPKNVVKYAQVQDGPVTWVVLGKYDPLHVFASTTAWGVSLDPIGDVFLVGGTTTETLEPYSQWKGSGPWILKLRADDGTRVYSSALGAEQDFAQQSETVNAARGVSVDAQGRAYVVGTALDGKVQGVGNAPHGGKDAFVLRMNIAGSGIDFRTYLGGRDDDQGLGITVDNNGWAYVAGLTRSQADYDPVNNPLGLQIINPIVDASSNKLSQLRGSQDAYIARLSSDGSALSMSAYYGGSGNIDQANAIAVKNGNIYFGGQTISTDMPVYPTTPTPVAGLTANAGGGDGFIAMILGSSFPKASVSTNTLSFGNQVIGGTSAVQTVTLSSTGPAPLDIDSISISGDFTETHDCQKSLAIAGAPGDTCTISIKFSPTVSGTRTGVLTIKDNAPDTPQTVGLQGLGVMVQTTVTPSGLSFPTTNLNQPSAAQLLTITNNDTTQTLTLATPTIPNSTEFVIDSRSTTCTTTLAHGASCAIGIIFTPSASGTRGAVLNLDGNGTSFPMTVQLQGVGGQPAGGAAGDFTVSGPTGGVAITAGQTGQVDITVAGTGTSGFTGSVALNCTVPSPATCSISPASVTLSGTTPGTAKMTVVVPGPKIPNPKGAFLRMQRTLEPVFAFCLFGLTIIGRRRRMVLVTALILAVCLVLVMSGCGGGGSSSGNYSSDTGMLPGTYTMTVTAVYSGSTTVTHTAPITLRVQ